ncbi:MAG: WD40 repeat domain-containing protein [Microcoleus sp. SU_5_6]|nr:WD40 repeat domain-containing protein [Microcoleus sp. SU_5_6]
MPARAPTWKCVRTLVGHSQAVTSVAFSPDGATLVSGSEDKTIEMWKVEAGKRWYTLTGHSDWVTCVVFSPDGRTLASGSRDKTIQIWDLNKGKWWYALRGHEDRVYAVAFSPDGQVLASGSRDKTVQLWNLNKGRPMRALSGHTEGVQAVAFSRGGEFLASGSRDRTLRLWDWQAGNSLCTLPDHGDWVRSIEFAPTSSSISPFLKGGLGGDLFWRRGVATVRRSCGGWTQRGKVLCCGVSGTIQAMFCVWPSVRMGRCWLAGVGMVRFICGIVRAAVCWKFWRGTRGRFCRWRLVRMGSVWQAVGAIEQLKFGGELEIRGNLRFLLDRRSKVVLDLVIVRTHSSVG